MPTPFFSKLSQAHTHHVFVTGPDPSFDPVTLSDWRSEGFQVTYVSFGEGGAEFVRSVQTLADRTVGVGDQYAIVAFGSSASPLLASLRHLPRLVAMVAYYPPQIPGAQGPVYPAGMRVLMHLCAGAKVSVTRRPEVLGLQGSRKATEKRVQSGMGLGGEVELGAGKNELGGNVRTYAYEAVSDGFAEEDMDEFDSNARDLAWGRSLREVRRAFGVETPDLESIRDEFIEMAGSQPAKVTSDGSSRINLPTLTGGFDAEGLREFYEDLFGPSAPYLRAKLVSRTVGETQVVDEMLISFKHDREVAWILPGVRPTGKQVKVAMVSVVGIKAGRCVSERVYWDQASVLVQIGMLDPALVSKKFGKGQSNDSSNGHSRQRMPVVGAEQAEAVDQGDDWDGNVNSLCDAIAGMGN